MSERKGGNQFFGIINYAKETAFKVAGLAAKPIDRATKLVIGDEISGDWYGAEAAWKARYQHVEKAVANNPEKRGVSTAILAACYMAYGPERVDLKKLGNDPLVHRLNGFLVAYNDQVDIAEKIQQSDPEVYDLIMKHVDTYKNNLNKYFEPTGNDQEDARRADFKSFYDVAFNEVNSIEHELFTVARPNGDQKVLESEMKRVTLGRELVNAIEILMNIRACAGNDIFEKRGIDRPVPTNIADLAKKYDWMINQNIDDKELTADEKKARMLYFVTMSDQAALDEIDFKEDRCFGIWKPMTYMTEILMLEPKQAGQAMQKNAERYMRLAQKSGMSAVPIIAANKFARLFSHIKNSAHVSEKARDVVASQALKSGHIRELAVNILKRKHPEKYAM